MEIVRFPMKKAGIGAETLLQYVNYAANYESDGGKLTEKWWFA